MSDTDDDKRGPGELRLRKYIDAVAEDALSFTILRCAITDISSTGMRVVADQYLAKGSKYSFTMKKPPFITLRGEVRWVRTLDRENVVCGVAFYDVPEVDRVRLTLFLDHERQRVPLTTTDA